MFSIIYLLLLVVIVVAATIFIYKLYYTHKINQRIKSGEVTGRKLVDLSKMIMIAVITGLVIYAGILMYVIHDYAGMEYKVSRNNYAIIDVSGEEYSYISYGGKEPLDDASFAKVYSKEENPGYEKEVVQSEDYRFVVFTRSAAADDFHPDFLCFVDYIGTKKEGDIRYSKAGFQSLEQDGGYFFDESDGDTQNSLLYIGNLDNDCLFNITMSILDSDAETKYTEAMHQAYEDDKGEFPFAEEFATTVGKVDIIIN